MCQKNRIDLWGWRPTRPNWGLLHFTLQIGLYFQWNLHNWCCGCCCCGVVWTVMLDVVHALLVLSGCCIGLSSMAGRHASIWITQVAMCIRNRGLFNLYPFLIWMEWQRLRNLWSRQFSRLITSHVYSEHGRWIFNMLRRSFFCRMSSLEMYPMTQQSFFQNTIPIPTKNTKGLKKGDKKKFGGQFPLSF